MVNTKTCLRHNFEMNYIIKRRNLWFFLIDYVNVSCWLCFDFNFKGGWFEQYGKWFEFFYRRISGSITSGPQQTVCFLIFFNVLISTGVAKCILIFQKSRNASLRKPVAKTACYGTCFLQWHTCSFCFSSPVRMSGKLLSWPQHRRYSWREKL